MWNMDAHDAAPEVHETRAGDNDERWDAVVRRDPNADGAFVYSVRTTGVYCRPSCAARRPRREHVTFHGTCADAEAAGFRPCKRCTPAGLSSVQQWAEVVVAACRAIESAESIPTLDALAAGAGVSRFHFQRMFKRVTGVTPRQYAAAHRMTRVHAKLRPGATVVNSLYDAGYESPSRFYASARDLLGMTPAAFRNGGRGVTIRFATASCALGAVLVAATDMGVCAIQLGDDPKTLRSALKERFPHADLREGGPDFTQVVSHVVHFVEKPSVGLELGLPVDVRGTAFQCRVWQALREIPPGATQTYAEVARRIGRPKSARAVARACAANEIALAIPCHRVVRTDGATGGYRWGPWRKQALLAAELGDGAMGTLARKATSSDTATAPEADRPLRATGAQGPEGTPGWRSAAPRQLQ